MKTRIGSYINQRTNFDCLEDDDLSKLSCRIVFMGTPDFAVPCLERLLADGYEVAGAFCQPDRPKGRGHKLCAPPVKESVQERGIPVYQPEKLRDGEMLRLLKELKPDLGVVVAYGRVLPLELLEAPRLGCVNIHASLLPELRGAAPIQWSVIRGMETTGVTSMHMAEGLDTGDMILQKATPIGPRETAGELFTRLSALGAECLGETIPLLLAGNAPRIPQDDALATWAPPITKEMALLDFRKPGAELVNLVRGLNPSPGARCYFEGKLLRVLEAAAAPEFTGKPGETLDADRMIVGCGDGGLELVTVQPEGKKPMSGAEFARGRRLVGGEMVTGKSENS